MDGWIILDKPENLSSRAAGARCMRMFGASTFGHIGTLDPMASGLLPIALGRATRVIPFMKTDCVKEYLFSVQFGFETDTLDVTGNETRRTDIVPTADMVAGVLPRFLGDISQIPPMFSAVHVNGVRAYRMARAGRTVDIPPRRVHIDALEFLGVRGASFHFRTRCSTGTYVRSLARDIASACNTVGTVDMIRRVETNGLNIKSAVKLDFLENLFHNGTDLQEYLQPIDFGLGDIPVLNLNDKDADFYKHGGFIAGAHGDGLARVYDDAGFIGIGTVSDGILRPKRTI
ncbi:MAG: tRNA pseudouridine(55) synthase TruB [Alphaproteobacteria bacterium]|nr:tRNA pseudouridine(55) synthase TruB [Alphaproteobacteria bacterium]MDE6571322.1 tRNA pseudouridine(55) synthase TruB [Alphaproteobacteria bacterium]